MYFQYNLFVLYLYKNTQYVYFVNNIWLLQNNRIPYNLADPYFVNCNY